MTDDKPVSDEFSDDETFDATAGVSSKRLRMSSKKSASALVPNDGGIMRAYHYPWDNRVSLEVLDDDVQFPIRILGPARAYPVFIGLLSLAAAKECRILNSSDLEHPRFCLCSPHHCC